MIACQGIRYGAFTDKVLCHDVLERMLEKRVGTLEDIQPQREFQYTVDGKPVRLDMYAGERKRIYDAEMQNLNHQSAKKLELPKRSRFYQSTMDTDHLSKGKSYRELPEGKVLFLCTFDPFGLGYAKYSFENLCKEDRELCLNDGTEKIFYNCACNPEKVPENLKELYDYIRDGKVGGDLTRRMDEAVRRARENEEWRSEYMKELLHDDDVREEGRNILLTLISKMSLGGDADKAAQLGNPQVLRAMQKKYGVE